MLVKEQRENAPYMLIPPTDVSVHVRRAANPSSVPQMGQEVKHVLTCNDCNSVPHIMLAT